MAYEKNTNVPMVTDPVTLSDGTKESHGRYVWKYQPVLNSQTTDPIMQVKQSRNRNITICGKPTENKYWAYKRARSVSAEKKTKIFYWEKIINFKMFFDQNKFVTREYTLQYKCTKILKQSQQWYRTGQETLKMAIKTNILSNNLKGALKN